MDLAAYEEIGECKITLKRAKKNISYPMVRFPSRCSHIAGKQAKIYRVDDDSYLVVIQNDERLHNQPQKLHNPKSILSLRENLNDVTETQKNPQNQNGCGGWDLNPGTPTGLAPQPSRFSLDYASVRADFTIWLSKRVIRKSDYKHS